MAQFDTVILNGTIVDGARAPRFQGSIGIKDGAIAAISREALTASEAERVVDASGLIVAPGFIDLHTHYDAQIQWDPYATLSGWHGVTSLVVRNCGFGFATVRPDERDRAMLSMSRVEVIPFESMKAVMLWDWITFPEWLSTLERIPKGVNVLSYVPVMPPFNTDPALNGELMASEYIVPGVSDGGAHTTFITLGRYTTGFIAHFCRDNDNLSLEEAHYRLSALPAKMAGFRDRYIFVNGAATFIDGECTNATPGRLLRHGAA